MKLKVTYERAAGEAVDLMITTSGTTPVEDIAAAILRSDPKASGSHAEAAVTLEAAPRDVVEMVTLAPKSPIDECPVGSGYRIRVVETAVRSERLGYQEGAAAVLRVVAGPDAGREFPLSSGTFIVGRDASADVVLTDAMVSRRHARVTIGESAEVVDLNSANGLIVDGDLVPRTSMQAGQTFMLGESECSIVLLSLPGDPPPAGAWPVGLRGGSIPFNRAPVVEGRFPVMELARPELPSLTDTPWPFLWPVVIAPIVLGIILYLLTRNALCLLLLAASPIALVANDHKSPKRFVRKRESTAASFDRQLRALDSELRELQSLEKLARNEESPATSTLFDEALILDSRLWTRRPEQPSFLDVRLGTGAIPSRITVATTGHRVGAQQDFDSRLKKTIEQYRLVEDVPIVDSIQGSGVIGVAGPAQLAFHVTRALFAQLACLNSPAEVVFAAIGGAQAAPEFEWLKWLPHTSSPQSPIKGCHLASTVASATTLVAQLESLVVERLDSRSALEMDDRLAHNLDGGAVTAQLAGDRPPLPRVVVLVADDLPLDRARFVQFADRAAAAGIYTLWLSSSTGQLPGVCRTFIDVGRGVEAADIHLVRQGVTVANVRLESLARDRALTLARRLAPVTDSSAVVSDLSDLPSSVSILTLLGAELGDAPAAVVDRWQQNFSIHRRVGRTAPRLGRAGTLRAVVGQRQQDAMHLDLRADGPHALVGGATGSGKSEFLQTWVLSMAAEYSPDRLTFLFVDYKGGAAFAACTEMPHCVGLITDLSPHLARRVLTSLRAEVRHRERLLHGKGTPTLAGLESQGDSDAPPTLVIVIDEFAALVGEVPEFVEDLLEIAQRGRSLGIHLIIATQRPAGAIRDNLRVNTKLRIALRMADERDSYDLLGSPIAAGFDANLPGRAAANLGLGRIVSFQSAYSGGRTSDKPPAATVMIRELRFGTDIVWKSRSDERDRWAHTSADSLRLVTTFASAARLAAIPAPRRPWLAELSRTYDLARLGPRHDREIVFGVVDRPEQQAQQSVYFRPDIDGNLAVYGASGSGKSVVLRTLAAAAGVTPRGGPIEVYGLDFAAGGLKMLETMSHVGSVVPRAEPERVNRLLRYLKDVFEQRARDYPQANAGSIVEYRELTGRQDEPRIMLMLDDFPAFRVEYEGATTDSHAYSIFQDLLSNGRQFGIHIVFTADQPARVPSAIASSVPRRVVLRLAERTMYAVLELPTDVISQDSPPGRAIVDGYETQIAILGGSGNVADQFEAVRRLSGSIASVSRRPVPVIGSLPTEVRLAELPVSVAGEPTLGLSDIDLGPIGFPVKGIFLLGGGPSSGRSTAVEVISRSLSRFDPSRELFYLGNRRSRLSAEGAWVDAAVTIDDVAGLATKLAAIVIGDQTRRIGVVVESLSDFLSTPADIAIATLVKAVKRSGHFLLAESDVSSWTSSFPLFAEVKSARRGVLLQPESIEGDAIMRTSFPRVTRSEFPPGRGFYVNAGRVVRVQLPRS